MLSRPAAALPGRATILLRRLVAGVVLVAAAAMTVVALGLLADGVSAARNPVPPPASRISPTVLVVPGAPSGPTTPVTP